MVSGRRKGDGPEDPDEPDLRARWATIQMTPQMEAMLRVRRVELEAELGHRLEDIELWRMILERSGECREGASTPAQISVCVHCNRGWQNGAGRKAELHPSELARALCDADHLGSVEGAPARKTATLTPRKRKKVISRDGHRCAVPGCRSARNLDVHHIRPRHLGGGNEDWNLITLCSGHHRAHHDGLLSIEGRAPAEIGFEFTGAGAAVSARVGTNGTHGAGVGTTVRRDRAERKQTVTVQPASSFDRVVRRTQARDALAGLGWKISIARAAVDEACAHVGTEASIDVLIREALRRCPRPPS